MPCLHIVDTVAAVFTALGTVGVALFAIYGDWFKDRLVGPRLSVSFFDPKGDQTFYGSGAKAYFYHLKVKNKSGRSAARGTRVVIRGISQRTPSGQFGRNSGKQSA